jgi:hypothetical protein
MTWCPGVPVKEDSYASKPQAKQDAMQQAFKEAHAYVISREEKTFNQNSF